MRFEEFLVLVVKLSRIFFCEARVSTISFAALDTDSECEVNDLRIALFTHCFVNNG